MQGRIHTWGSTSGTLPPLHVSFLYPSLAPRLSFAYPRLQYQQLWERQASTAVAAAAADDDGRPITDQDALAWTFSESPCQSSPSPDIKHLPSAQDQQQRQPPPPPPQQEQQQQHRRRAQARKAPTLQQKPLQQQSKHHSRDVDVTSRALNLEIATGSSSNDSPGRLETDRPSVPQRSHSHDASNEPVSVDPYIEAQQRVRAVLAAADPSNAAAAAELLSDTVNDLTIALQLLATAPRPSTLAEFRQYETAVARLGEAVLLKYKAMLLRLLPAAPSSSSSWTATPLQQQQHVDKDDDEQRHLAAAMASLPATKVAATSFSMGVLKLYDRQLVPALEEASLQMLRRGAFKPNQLGQLVQGFVYLDHNLSSQWHDVFLQATRASLRSMQAPQVASVAVWLTTYLLRSTNAALQGTGTSSVELQVQSLLPPAAPAEAVTVTQSAACAAASPRSAQLTAAAPAPWHCSTPQGLDADWVQRYLQAVERCAARLTPLQLTQVLQACAALVHASSSSTGQQCGVAPVGLQQLTLMQGLPIHLGQVGPTKPASSTHPQRRQQAEGHQPKGRENSRYRSSTGATRARGWAAALAYAFQRLMPELSMSHLAGALPALMQLTQCPWPHQHLQPLLLQVRLQLPWCTGRELILVTQAVTRLAAPGVLAAEHGWCDAVLTQLHSQFAVLGPEDLAGAVLVAALLQAKPYKAWMYAFYQRLRIDGKMLDSGQVLQVLEGLAAIGAVLDPELLHVLVSRIKRWMPIWGSAELLRVVEALRSMYPKVLPGRTVHQLVLELQRRQHFLDLAQEQQHDLF